MGIIDSGLRSIGVKRAKLFRTVEKIVSESVESEIDDRIQSVCSGLFGDDDLDDEVDNIADIIPDTGDDTEPEEIENIMDSEEPIIGIDDILGIEEDDDPINI